MTDLAQDRRRRSAAARDELTNRTRQLTAAALALSAALAGAFAGLAAASTPGRHLQARTTTVSPTRQPTTTTSTKAAIPPLPPAPGPGSDSAPAPAPAPPAAPLASTSAPPVVVSGGS